MERGHPARAPDGALTPGRSAPPVSRLGVGALTAAALGTYLAALLYLFFRWCGPFTAYPYDWEPSDGDIVNAALRLLHGRPVYGDWRLGDVSMTYPPAVAYALAGAVRLHLDPVTSGRTLGVLLFAGAILLLLLAAALALREAGAGAAALVPATGILLLTRGEAFTGVVNLRPDPLLLFLSLAVSVLLVARPAAPVSLLAPLVLAAMLAKQPGLGLAVAVAAHDGLRRDWRHLGRFAAALAALTALAVGYLEVRNQGHFLDGVLWYPRLAFSGSWLQWGKLARLAAAYYGRTWGDTWWVVPLVLAGLVAGFRSRLRPVAVVFLVDALLQLHLGRNLGASVSYLWLHWSLASLLAARGALALGDLLARGLRSARPASVRSLLFATTAAACALVTAPRLAGVEPPDLARFAAVAARHERRVAELAAAHPGARWAATRSALAVVRAGGLLDQEFCNVAIAYSHPDRFDPAVLRRRFARGEYGLVQRGFTGCGPDPLDPVYDACFREEARSAVVFLGRVLDVALLRYDGGRPACAAFR